MKVGWPTGGSGSELEPLAYIRRLPALLEQVNGLWRTGGIPKTR
jgi:hypothetical protein